MPHLTLEYTSNLAEFDAQEALAALNKALAGTGHFDEVDIKSRSMSLNAFAVGTSPGRRAFIHAKLAILSGRPPEVKRALSDTLLQELRRLCGNLSGHHVQLCAEIVDIDRASYAKDVIGVDGVP
jgi:5-carboxymethyl-2-hydroxymuconate isomerase